MAMKVRLKKLTIDINKICLEVNSNKTKKINHWIPAQNNFENLW